MRDCRFRSLLRLAQHGLWMALALVLATSGRDESAPPLLAAAWPRIDFTAFTGNTVGGILIESPAERAQSASSEKT